MSRLKIAGCTFSKAEHVLLQIGTGGRHPSKIRLVKGHSGALISRWLGTVYQTEGRRRDVGPTLDRWQAAHGTPGRRGLALATAVAECGDVPAAAHIHETTLAQFGNTLGAAGKLSGHCFLVNAKVIAGDIAGAHEHAQAAGSVPSSVEISFLA